MLVVLHCYVDTFELLAPDCVQMGTYDKTVTYPLSIVWLERDPAMKLCLSLLPSAVTPMISSFFCECRKQSYAYLVQTIRPGGHFKNAYELLNLRALKISMLYKNHIFQCMGKIFCVEFQRVPLKFHTKYLSHTLKDVDFFHM